jgi:hypothetical protein
MHTASRLLMCTSLLASLLAATLCAQLSIASPAQAEATKWQKAVGGTSDDSGQSAQQTSDGGYIVVGTTASYGAGNEDIWIIKTDAYGNEDWRETFGGSATETGSSVDQTSNGYVILGTTASLGAGGTDMWLIGTGQNGEEEWNKTFGGSRNETGRSVQQTSDGGYIVAGETNSSGAGGLDAWLVKVGSDGTTMEWNRTFGGPDDEFAHCVHQTSDGGYVIAGVTHSYGAGSGDIWLIKTNSAGIKEWDKTFGGPNHDAAYSVRQTSDEGYIVAGETSSYGAGSSDMWFLRIGRNGGEVWNRTYGSSLSDSGRSALQTSDSSYVLVGHSTLLEGLIRSLWMIETDSDGNTTWDRTLSGGDGLAGHSIEKTSDGGYIVAGVTPHGAGGTDLWLVKTDSEGVTDLLQGTYCFIATAAYGTPMAKELEILRDFRDQYLLTNQVGEALVEFYYWTSPPVANIIADHSALGVVVRTTLGPVVALTRLTVSSSLIEKGSILGSFALICLALTAWARQCHRRSAGCSGG